MARVRGGGRRGWINTAFFPVHSSKVYVTWICIRSQRDQVAFAHSHDLRNNALLYWLFFSPGFNFHPSIPFPGITSQKRIICLQAHVSGSSVRKWPRLTNAESRELFDFCFSTISLITKELEKQSLVEFQDQNYMGNENFGEDFSPTLADHCTLIALSTSEGTFNTGQVRLESTLKSQTALV